MIDHSQPATGLAFGDALSCTGTVPVPLHYTDEPLDSESGLHHFLFRQLSTTQGRWATSDPAGLDATDPTDPASWNRYAYVENYPSGAFDPLGLKMSRISLPGGGCWWCLYGQLQGANTGIWMWSEFGLMHIPAGTPNCNGECQWPESAFDFLAFLDMNDAANTSPACLAGAGPLAVGQSRCAANHLAAQSECVLYNGVTQITYALENPNGSSQNGYYVTEHIVDRATGQPNSTFTQGDNRNGPGTSSGGSSGYFIDWIGGTQSWDILQTFTVSTTPPGQGGANTPVFVIDNSGQVYGTNGIYYQPGNLAFINGKQANAICQ